MKTKEEILFDVMGCDMREVGINDAPSFEEIMQAMEKFALQFEDDNGRAQYYEDKIDMLNRILSTHEWISVEDRLPTDMGQMCLCDNPNGMHAHEYRILRFDTYNKNWYDGYDTLHPTHWMPLPKFPNT